MSNDVLLNKQNYSVTRKKLREWLGLEDIKIKIQKAVDTKDIHGYCNTMLSYISTALSLSVEELENCAWYEVANAFIVTTNVNIPSLEYPILKSKILEDTQAWDYEGRTFYLWAHILSNAYGWQLEYVADLDIDDAIALAQEIVVENQLKKEWEWSMSELAYSYDKGTQKSKFNPLPRPDWMQPIRHQIVGRASVPEKIRIKQSMMPMGLVVKLEDDRQDTNIQ